MHCSRAAPSTQPGHLPRRTASAHTAEMSVLRDGTLSTAPANVVTGEISVQRTMWPQATRLLAIKSIPEEGRRVQRQLPLSAAPMVRRLSSIPKSPHRFLWTPLPLVPPPHRFLVTIRCALRSAQCRSYLRRTLRRPLMEVMSAPSL